MIYPEPSISVEVNASNPGQFFACCGLLELADRLWPGAEGWFSPEDDKFRIAAKGSLESLVEAIADADIIATRADDPYSSPLLIGKPFRPLTVDWWESDMTGARDLKVWAGTMESVGIGLAMQHALRSPEFRSPKLFNIGMVATTPHDGKKKEPYYFDSRRTPNAHARDIGFSPNDLNLTSIAHPAVELLCLVGLQVARPAPTEVGRIYDYHTWHTPLLPNLLLAVSSGMIQFSDSRRYRFENWFRTGQKKHKAFRSAVILTQGNQQ